MPKGPHGENRPADAVMRHRTSSRFIIAGVAVVIASIVLIDLNYGDGIIGNILRGATILDTDVQARWPLLAGFALICWGAYQRLNSN